MPDLSGMQVEERQLKAMERTIVAPPGVDAWSSCPDKLLSFQSGIAEDGTWILAAEDATVLIWSNQGDALPGV